MKRGLIIVLFAIFALATFSYAQPPKVAIIRGDPRVLKDSWQHEEWKGFVPNPEGVGNYLYWAPEWTPESETEIEGMVRNAVDAAEGWPVQRGDTVLIKVNANADLFDQFSKGKAGSNELLCMTTDARVARAVALLCRESGAKEIYIADGPGVADGICSLIAFGHNEYAKEIRWVLYRWPSLRFRFLRIENSPKLVDLNNLPYRFAADLRRPFREYAISNVVLDADVVISVSPMKTHSVTGVSCTLKNIGIGCPTAEVYGAPKIGLPHDTCHRTIADVCVIVDPDYGVISGIYGGEGVGPLNCDPVYMGLVIAGSDLVAVDATACKVMGFDPSNYGTLREAQTIGVGTFLDIEYPGLDPSDPGVTVQFFDVPISSRAASGFWGGVTHWQPPSP